MTTPNAITETNMPGMYQAADTASKDAQSNYLLIVGLDLIFMIIAAAIAIYNYGCESIKIWTYVVCAIFLLLGLIFSIILKTKKFEDTWYQGRALAESCKTITWRFITCSEGFEVSLPEEQVQLKFVETIKSFSIEFKELNESLDATVLSLPVITNLMWQIRRLPTIERKKYYLEHRIENQKSWYSLKANHNRKLYNRWFAVIVIGQFLALISASYMIYNYNSDWNLIGLFTTIASAAISWLQLKQHQELKQAYTTAAQELNFIMALSDQIHTDIELARFVLDSENAISREHTLWLAQKRKSG